TAHCEDACTGAPCGTGRVVEPRDARSGRVGDAAVDGGPDAVLELARHPRDDREVAGQCRRWERTRRRPCRSQAEYEVKQAPLLDHLVCSAHWQPAAADAHARAVERVGADRGAVLGRGLTAHAGARHVPARRRTWLLHCPSSALPAPAWCAAEVLHEG